MIEVVREGSLWTPYRDGTPMLFSSFEQSKAVNFAKRHAAPNETVKVDDSAGSPIDDDFQLGGEF